MTWAPIEVIPDPYVPTDWRECGACHARKPGVTGTPPHCRRCRALGRHGTSGPAPPGPPAGQEPAAGPEAP